MVKVSVVIPVYNVANYLERCLNSVCNQTLRDIEIICVDDCSTDSSAEILQKYAKKYPNLTVKILEKNQGVSVARNFGLSLAKGEYVAFVDSDDEIDLNFYEKLYEKAQATNADLVKGQAIEISYDGKRNVVKQIQEGSKWFFLYYWVLAIYKRSLICENNISFSAQHSLGEDLLFLNQAVVAAKNLQLVDGVYYYYYRREDSGDAKILSEEKIKSVLDIYEKIIDNANENLLPDDLMYKFVFHHFILSCSYISLRNEEKKSRQFCAKKIFDIFAECRNQDGLEQLFSKTLPYLFVLLKDKNLAGLEDVLTKCKTIPEIIISGLRARIKSDHNLTRNRCHHELVEG